MKIRVLVTGANGQLGKAIREVSKNVTDVIEFVFADKFELDITQKNSLETYFKTQDFNYCINCAAYTNVDLAETEKDKSFRVNAFAVNNLAIICNRFNIVLIHMSTDYVFDGTKSTPYLETDKTNPINSYGQSKLLGEQHIQKHLQHYFIIRTSWLFSKFNGNFVTTIYNKLIKDEQLNVITSQKGVPTSCTDLAYFLIFLIKHRIINFGIYHYVPCGDTSWYGLALHIAMHLNKPSNVLPIEDYPSKAKRPLYSVLDNNKAKDLLNVSMQNWTDSVDDVLKVLSKL